MKENRNIFLVVGVAAILIFLMKSGDTQSLNIIGDGKWDISSEVAEKGYNQHLAETADFDYSNQQVYKLAQDIKGSTDTPYDAVKKTARYVYENVQYNSKISIGYCYDETASLVLETGTGDCVSMSRLVTALLRAQGIPARTVGGCLNMQRCSPLFAVLPSAMPQYVPMTEGDFKKRGFLHEWVEVWTPEKSWVLIEATSGQVFSTACESYLQYSYDTNKYDRCVITEASFWELCAAS